MRSSSPAGARLPRGPVLLAALGAFALALLVLPRHLGVGDSAEFTLALSLAGVPHPTGYPWYVLLGHGFVVVLHAIGISWVVAAAVWSAVGAAVAASALVRAAQHLLAGAGAGAGGSGTAVTPRMALPAWVPVMLPAALLALNPVWMRSATIAEVYSWHHALVALAIAFTAGCLRRIDVGGGPLAARDALRWGWLCGLGIAHHATFVFFALPLSLALLAAHLRAGGRRAPLLASAVACLPPLAGFAWLAWRAAHPAPYQWPLEAEASAVWRHVTGAAYGGYLGGFAPKPAEWAAIRHDLLVWVVPGIVLGAVLALRLPRPALRLGALAALAGAALIVTGATVYGVPDPATYFLAPLMVALFAIAPLVQWLAQRVSPLVAGAVAAAVVLALASYSIPFALGERVRLARIDARFRAAWARVPFERGMVIFADDHAHRLVLLQILEGANPGVDVVNPDLLTWPARRAAFVKRHGFDPAADALANGRFDRTRVVDHLYESREPVVEFPALLSAAAEAAR